MLSKDITMRNLLFVVFILLLPVDTFSWTQVQTAQQIEPNKTYIITFQNSNGAYHTINSEYWESYDIYHMRSNDFNDNSYKTIEQLEGHTTLFRFEKIEDKWYLYSINDSKYVGESTNYRQLTLFSLSETANENCIVEFERDGNLLLKISGRYFQHQPTSADYRLNSSRKENCDIQLWMEGNSGETTLETLTLSSDEDLTVDEFYGNVIFKREFFNDTYNTFIVPFNIENYRKIFGSDVTAYEWTKVNGKTLEFESVEGKDLKANTPYLLKGTFTSNTFNFNAIDVKSIAEDGKIQKKRGNTLLIGTYKRENLSRRNTYVLWKTNFYTTLYVDLFIEPYKWYLQSADSKVEMKIVNH